MTRSNPYRRALMPVIAAAFACSVISADALAIPLSVSFEGFLDDADSRAFTLRFDIDTAAVAGNYQSGTCNMPAGGGAVSDVFTEYNVSGGVSNANFSVEGLATDFVLSSANFFYNFDSGDLCKFYMGFDLNFASGLSIRSFNQFLATPYYSTLTTSPAQLVALSLIDGYDISGPRIATVAYQGADLGHVINGHGNVNVVPEPSTLALLALSLGGVALLGRRKTPRKAA